MCAFPDSADAGANMAIGYLPGRMPWILGAALQGDGITLTNDPAGETTGATTRDRNFLSGDSPLAFNELGKMAATALVERTG